MDNTGHPSVITSTKSKVQRQPSNIYTFCCMACELLLLNIRAFGEKYRLPRMLYHNTLKLITIMDSNANSLTLNLTVNA